MRIHPEHEDSPYNFKDKIDSDVRSLIHVINFLGDNLVGLELGVCRADSFVTILQNCPNVKTLHGVDPYLPYGDCLKDPYDGQVAFTVDHKSIALTKALAENKIQYSGSSEKVVFHEMEGNEAAKAFEPQSLDFIFVDAYMTYEQVRNDLEVWYPIVKDGGLFAGHDWGCSVVEKAVNEFREENNITQRMSTYDDCFCWFK